MRIHLDWIVQDIFGLAPLLDEHDSAQLRISSPGLSLLREVVLAVDKMDACREKLSTTDIATFCEAASIDIPGCQPGTELEQRSRRIGSLFGPVFKESAVIKIEGFEVTRTIERVPRADRPDELQDSKFYWFEKRVEK